MVLGKKITDWTNDTVLCTIDPGKVLVNATTQGKFQ